MSFLAIPLHGIVSTPSPPSQYKKPAQAGFLFFIWSERCPCGHRVRDSKGLACKPSSGLQHVGEILAAHHAVGLVVHPVVAGDGTRHVGGETGLLHGVHRHGVAAAIGDVGGQPEGGAELRGHGAQPLLDKAAHLVVEGADGTGEPDRRGDDVEGVAGLQHGHRQDGRAHRIDIARHHRLQRQDELRRGDDRIVGEVRQRRVAADAVDGDGEFIRRRHDAAGPDGELAGRQAGQIVEAIDLLDREALHQAILEHGASPCPAFFGGLEDEHGLAVEIARLGEVARGAEQHGGVPVMAAGMHLSRHGRGPGLAGGLADRQRVHVGTQADGPARAAVAAIDDGHDARAADAGHHLVDAETAQQLGDAPGSALHVILKLGVPMKILPPVGDLRGEIGDAVDDGHGKTSKH